jgi:hypothetical protein
MYPLVGQFHIHTVSPHRNDNSKFPMEMAFPLSLSGLFHVISYWQSLFPISQFYIQFGIRFSNDPKIIKELTNNSFIAHSETCKERKKIITYAIKIHKKIFDKLHVRTGRKASWFICFPWFHWLTGRRCVCYLRLRLQVLDFVRKIRCDGPSGAHVLY